MTKRKRVLLTIAASLGGLLLIALIAIVVVLQTNWFSNFVREKVIVAAEDATGGKVDIGAFEFDWSHLSIRIRNFVLHGREPRNADPLLRARLLELRLKLFTQRAIDLQYLGLKQPQANVIVFPDGTTNIPEPKTKSKPSSSSSNPLETVVDLAVKQFDLSDGLLQYAQRKTAFNARGENLSLQLLYNQRLPRYQGELALDPLLITSGTRPTLGVHIHLPLVIEKDAIRLADGRINTAESQITINTVVEHLVSPRISAQLKANVSLPEIGRSIELPVDTMSRNVPKIAVGDFNVRMDGDDLSINTAHIGLGRTVVDANGDLRRASGNAGAQFKANLDFPELSRLFKVTSPETSGALLLHGAASLDKQNNYLVDGSFHTEKVSIRSGTTRLSNVSLASPFHVDPHLISLNRLSLNALGGGLNAKILLEEMQRLTVNGRLQDFNLKTITQLLTGKDIGYDGTLSGPLNATGDLKAKGTSGYSADARLIITPGRRGTPVSGRLSADYRGATGAVDLQKSYIALPNSRLDLAGSLNKRIDVNFISHNLDDFLPAMAFGSTSPDKPSLPVSLRGGAVRLDAQITGNTSAPDIKSHLAMTQFAVEQRPFDNFALDLAATQRGAAIRNGVLSRNALQTTFDASLGLQKWSPLPRSPLAANLQLRNGNLAELLQIPGETTPPPATGDLSADVHINGTFGNPLGAAELQVVNGSAQGEPFDRLYTKVNLLDRLIKLTTLELAAGEARIAANGTFAHPRESFSTGHAQFHVGTEHLQLANLKTIQKQNAGVAGLIQLTADAAADVRSKGKTSEVSIADITADLKADGLKVQNQDAGTLTAQARTANGTANYNLRSNFAGSRIRVDGRTGLAAGYQTDAAASIQDLSVEKTLKIVGQAAIPAAGIFSADARVRGTADAPAADLNFNLRDANVYSEPLNRFGGTVHYTNTQVEVPTLTLDAPSGNIDLAASFNHPANNFNVGAVKAKLNSSDIRLAKINHLQKAKPGLAGTLHLAADVSADLRQRHGKSEVFVSDLLADLNAGALRVNDTQLGQANFRARTKNQQLHFNLESDIAQTRVRGVGDSQLTGDYPIDAKLTFQNIRYSNLLPFINEGPSERPDLDALVEGSLTAKGPTLNTENLEAKLQLDRLEAFTAPQKSPTGAPPPRAINIHNAGPIIVALNHMVVQIVQMHIEGPSTHLNASGDINLKNTKAPIHLGLDADADLKVLQDFDREVYSSGNVLLQTQVRGNFDQPLVNGKVELKNANLNLADSPNGLSNGNGVILLNGTSASIRNLTGESGGGKISASGFVGLSGRAVTFNLRAAANKVRSRYAGVSVTTSANVSLVGSTQRSLASGTVTIQRVAYASSVDTGSLLSNASTPPTSSAGGTSSFLEALRLDVRIVTAPDLRVITDYAQRLHVEADLNLRGTAATPGMVGAVNVTDGQLVLFGNQYTVNQGTINFYNPIAIEPILNLSLETNAQGVDVTIGLAGSIDNLKLSYRSDPPLQFEEIVQLLATNKTPASDPTIAAHQPTPPQQSYTQMGESAVVGQAVANPLASRVQRVFGISQFKIDPSFAGNSGAPSARVTLQQQVTNSITFTYVTDVTKPNSQIIRIEWAFNPRFSAVALRDQNGVLGVDVFYRRKYR